MTRVLRKTERDQASSPVPAMVVTLTVEQLQTLVHETALAACAEALAGQPPVPELLDTATAAHALSVSTQTLNKWGREGCPCVRRGDVRRWRVADVLEWLRRSEAT